MKLRIVKKNSLFIPQYYGKTMSSYSETWLGFGRPNVKFVDMKGALEFIRIVEKSCFDNQCGRETNVQWKNYEGELSKNKKL